jgi:hypothetical protein
MRIIPYDDAFQEKGDRVSSNRLPSMAALMSRSSLVLEVARDRRSCHFFGLYNNVSSDGRRLQVSASKYTYILPRKTMNALQTTHRCGLHGMFRHGRHGRFRMPSVADRRGSWFCNREVGGEFCLISVM